MKQLKWLFSTIRGDDFNLTLEHRIFNLTSFFGVVLFLIAAISNAILQLEVITVTIPLIAALCLSILHYFSRFEGQFIVPAFLSVPVLYGLTWFVWFANGGQAGSIIHPLQIDFLFFLAIFPKKYHLPITLFHILIVSSLYVMEYLHPEWVSPYESRMAQMIDQIITFTFCVIGVYAVIMSIKEMYEAKSKELEKQKEDLETVNLLKDKMLSVISHDVRSPLAQLNSLLSIVNQVDTEQREYLFNQISKNVTETQNLLDTLVAWASIQLKKGSMTLKLENIVLRDIVKEEVSLFANQINHKKIEIIYHFQTDAALQTDKNMFALIVRNLLSNAIKFSKTGGSITFQMKKEKDFSVFSIQDTGIGIDAKRLNNLLNLGKNESTRGTANEKGAGLGLLLCKEFIEEIGGKLHVESTQYKGSTFFVYMPD